jgi:hypothetical protein
MPHFVLEKLDIHKMASGHLCLNLSESVEWDQFPQFAEKLAAILGAGVSDIAKSVEMRIWHLQFPTCKIMFVYDDFPQLVSLESDSFQGDDILKNLVEQLKGKTVTWGDCP